MASHCATIVTRYRRTIRWRGKRMIVVRYRYSYAFYAEPQKYVYFSRACDPLDWSSANYTVETKTPA